jgi:hypothetical protein
LAYRIFFEDEIFDYSVTGKVNVAKNTVRCNVPDSLAEHVSGGDCVVDVLMDNKSGVIKKIDIIGFYFYDNLHKTDPYFDIYDSSKRGLGKPYNKGDEQLTAFVYGFVRTLTFKKLTKARVSTSHAYCRLLFSKMKNQGF